MINPKDPFHPILSKGYGNDYYHSGGMTVELEIASRILAVQLGREDSVSYGIQHPMTLYQWALDHARQLIEEANK